MKSSIGRYSIHWHFGEVCGSWLVGLPSKHCRDAEFTLASRGGHRPTLPRQDLGTQKRYHRILTFSPLTGNMFHFSWDTCGSPEVVFGPMSLVEDLWTVLWQMNATCAHHMHINNVIVDHCSMISICNVYTYTILYHRRLVWLYPNSNVAGIDITTISAAISAVARGLECDC